MHKITTEKGIIIIKNEPIQVTITAPTFQHYKRVLGQNIKLGQTVFVDINQLPPQSNKKVCAICPICKKERYTSYANLIWSGHSYCQKCHQRLSAYSSFIGKKTGRLTITGFGEPATTKSGGLRTTFTATCDCGNETTVWAQSVKRAFQKNAVLSCGCYRLELIKNIGMNNVGPNNGMYNPLITDEEREYRIKRRKIQKAKDWTANIKSRDQCCVICNSNRKLVAHHLYDFITYEDLRYSLSNGITLCATCHQDFHYGYLGNTTSSCTAPDFYSYLHFKHQWADSRINQLIATKNLLT